MEAAGALVIIEAGADRFRLEQAREIRRRVFIEEQHVPEEIELDVEDALAFHALALKRGTPVGCGRMVSRGDYVKIGRMAVLQQCRGEGIGRAVLQFLIEQARRNGFRRAVLDAQTHAEGFYQKQGFIAVGEIFEEAGIPHRRMERAL